MYVCEAGADLDRAAGDGSTPLLTAARPPPSLRLTHLLFLNTSYPISVHCILLLYKAMLIHVRCC